MQCRGSSTGVDCKRVSTRMRVSRLLSVSAEVEKAASEGKRISSGDTARHSTNKHYSVQRSETELL